MMTWPQQLRLVSLRTLALLIPKAHTGSFWLDLVYLLLVMALQVSILPSLVGAAYLDLLTPWLAFTFIAQPTTRAMLLALIAALAIENHGTTPAGLYVCSYWIMGTLIVLVKKHISWRNLLPWLATFAVSEAWMVMFETFVYLIKTASLGFLSLGYAAGSLLRLGVAIGVGYLISRRGTYPVAEDKSS